MDEVDYMALRAELDNDPSGLGYEGTTDEEAADLLGEIGLGGQTKERESVSALEVLEAADFSELKALTAEDQRLYQILISPNALNIKSPRTRAMFSGLFGSGTQTRANLIALQDEPASRREILGWPFIAYWDIGRARAL